MSFEEVLESIVRRVLREEFKDSSHDDRLLTAEQVAEILGYTDVTSVYRLKREGRLTGYVLTEKALRFKNAEVQEFIKSLKVAA